MDARLEEIRKRAEAATPGPWIAPTNASADTKFSAHAREDIPYLLYLVAEQQAEIIALRQGIGDALSNLEAGWKTPAEETLRSLLEDECASG